MIDGLRASDDHIEEPGKKDKSDCPSASELISLGKLYRTEDPDNESKQAADSADGKKSQHGSARTCEIGGAVCTECCGYRINNKIYDSDENADSADKSRNKIAPEPVFDIRNFE